MQRAFERRVIFFMGIVLALLSGMASMNAGAAQKAAADEVSNMNPRKLTSRDKVQLNEALKLKKEFGSIVWPEFADTPIPLILYNEQFEFLIGHPSPPFSWTEVDNDRFQDRIYYRRPAGKTQAFAVAEGELWAGSLDTLTHMNQMLEKQLRIKIPQDKLTPEVIKMMEISPAQHVVALLHEAFHAFQAMTSPRRFTRTNAVYALEQEYPYRDKAFIEAWNREGDYLIRALRQENDRDRRSLLTVFLEVRQNRRMALSLPPKLTALERELEWLEGLGKYVELRFSEVGAAQQESEMAKDYRIVRNRLRMDFFSRLKNLGALSGDLRFYLSGAAQALLLDKLHPKWKQEISADEDIGLEDLLLAATVECARSDR